MVRGVYGDGRGHRAALRAQDWPRVPTEVRRAACAEHQTRGILTEALGEALAMSPALCEVQS